MNILTEIPLRPKQTNATRQEVLDLQDRVETLERIVQELLTDKKRKAVKTE